MNFTVILQLIQTLAPILLKLAESANSGEVQHMQSVLYYNEKTKEKVIAFQKAHGLTEDGIVGDETWSKVEELTGRNNAR